MVGETGEVARAKTRSILQARIRQLDFKLRAMENQGEFKAGAWHDFFFFKDYLRCWMQSWEASQEETAVTQLKGDGDLDRGCGHGNEEKWTNLKYSLRLN